MKVLMFLQNQWARQSPTDKDRELVRQMAPDVYRLYVGICLLGGCKTGRMLQTAFRDRPWKIDYDNASKGVATVASGKIPADLDHMRASLDDLKPDVAVGLGRVAEDALRKLAPAMPALYAPHPTARRINGAQALSVLCEQLELLERLLEAE